MTTKASARAGLALLALALSVKVIRMRWSSEPGITHESQWATLTFEVR